MQRMFLAVVPPDEVLDEINDLPTRPQRGVSFTRRAQWHITLKFLGQTNPADALTALAAIDATEATVCLGPKVSLLGTRIVMLPASGLDDLAATTASAFQDVGEPQDPREFAAHLTLARLKGAPLKNPDTVSVLGAPFDITFPATALELISTEVTDEGTIHTVVAEKLLNP